MEKTTFNEVKTVGGDFDAITKEPVDDQCANDAITGNDLEPVHSRTGAGAVDFDNRNAGESRLR